MPPAVSRRTVLKRAAVAAGTLAGSSVLAAPHVLAGPSPQATLNIAVIGCGGRGEASLAAAADERVVAIVDVDDGRLAAAAEQISAKGARPRTFFDYREMFDTMHKDIDAVFIATPDHHHAPASLIALQLGKHVFCEKPLCHDVYQARTLAAAAKKQRVTTMLGNQGHCAEGYRRLCEYVWAGAIGDVVETHSWNHFENGGEGGRPASRPVPAGLHWNEWLGPAPERDYHEGLHPALWRFWYDFGTGGLGDWGCHNLDGVFWALRIGHPVSVECLETFGGSEDQFPRGVAIRWDIPAREQMPALKVYWYNGVHRGARDSPGPSNADPQLAPIYPPMLAELEARCGRNFREGWDGGTFYLGTRGIMHTGSYGETPRILPDDAHQAFPAPPRQIPRIKGSHFSHFLECCKAGQPTCADFEYGAAITEFLLLGQLALHAGVGVKVEWDGPAMRSPNHPELDRWLRQECRKGWEV